MTARRRGDLGSGGGGKARAPAEWHSAMIADAGRLRELPGVLSVSIGYKEVRRSVTSRVCVKIYVAKKLAAPRPDERLPRTALLVVRLASGLYVERRVPTDVVEVKGVTLIGKPWARVDPVPMGAQIGLARGQGIDGSLGCWVTKRGLEPACFLTAGHVVISCRGNVPDGQIVYQPRPRFSVPDADDVLGHTAEGFVGNDRAAGGYVDYAAVVVPAGRRRGENRSAGPCIASLGPHLSVEQVLRERTPVRKFGATTLCTEGVLSAYHALFDDGTGRTFENVLEFTSGPGEVIAGHGDSGAMVVSRGRASEGGLVGLLFAVSHDHSRGFVVPFERFERLGFRVADPA